MMGLGALVGWASGLWTDGPPIPEWPAVDGGGRPEYHILARNVSQKAAGVKTAKTTLDTCATQVRRNRTPPSVLTTLIVLPINPYSGGL